VNQSPRSAFLTLAGICAVGLLFTQRLLATGVALPQPLHNITYSLFAFHDPPFLIVLFAFCLGTFLFYPKRIASAGDLLPDLADSRRHIGWIAIAVFLICWTGHRVVFANFPLSMDEFAICFQAELFAEGHLHGPLPEEVKGMVPSITPLWIRYNPETHTWVMKYLPIYALLKAAFLKIGLQTVISPIFAGISVLTLAWASRLLLPGNREARWICLLMLISSAQFLITAMTHYTMSAHLAFNLLWLCLYLRNRTWSWLLLPWVGFMAMGLHQPLAHLLFVFPFCLRILFNRPLKTTLYVAGVYAVACLFWLWWMSTVAKSHAPATGSFVQASFLMPGSDQLAGRIINLVYLITWQNPLMAFFLIIAARNWKLLGSLERDLIFSAAFSFVFFLFYVGIGGHGWGARHSHPVLGNLCLLAGLIWARKPAWQSERPSAGFLLAVTAVALVALFPLRALQSHFFNKPFVETHRYLRSLETDFVVLDHAHGWYLQDLVRNDPLLRERPVMAYRELTGPAERAQMESIGTVRDVPVHELIPFGIREVTYPEEIQSADGFRQNDNQALRNNESSQVEESNLLPRQ
jgi:hypothetical protein